MVAAAVADEGDVDLVRLVACVMEVDGQVARSLDWALVSIVKLYFDRE